MGKNILIGISGGIAAYKTLDLIHQLEKSNHSVKVILTPHAKQFVTPLCVQTLSKNPVYSEEFEIKNFDMHHIELSKWAHVVLVAPVTANTLAKLAHGLADNLLTSTLLALTEHTPVLLAPAMNTNMWQNPQTTLNLTHIMATHPHYEIIGPREGRLACGDTGMGAMAENPDILAKLSTWLN